jgi:hypothetical protein
MKHRVTGLMSNYLSIHMAVMASIQDSTHPGKNQYIVTKSSKGIRRTFRISEIGDQTHRGKFESSSVSCMYVHSCDNQQRHQVPCTRHTLLMNTISVSPVYNSK